MSTGVRLKSALSVTRAAKLPGLHPAGDGLYLAVGKAGGASWVLRYYMGKAREMGLGPLSLIGLSKARRLATEARLLRQQGIDPIAAKKAQRAAALANAAKAVTFRASAERYVSTHASGWKSPRTAAQWRQSIATYCKHVLNLPVGMID